MNKLFLFSFLVMFLLFAKNSFADDISLKMANDEKLREYYRCSLAAEYLFKYEEADNVEKRIKKDFAEYNSMYLEDEITAYARVISRATAEVINQEQVIYNTKFCQQLYKK